MTIGAVDKSTADVAYANIFAVVREGCSSDIGRRARSGDELRSEAALQGEIRARAYCVVRTRELRFLHAHDR